MWKDRDNPLALSSKNPNQDLTGCRRELRNVNAGLAAKQACNRGKKVPELMVKQGCQNESSSCQHLLAKDVNSTIKKKSYTKLEKLLLALFGKIICEQDCHKLQHKREFELKKAIFLCHLLETHRGLLQKIQRARSICYVCGSILRKPAQQKRLKSCQTAPSLTGCASLNAATTSRTKFSLDQRKELSAGHSSAANYYTTSSVVDLPLSGSQKTSHPLCSPYADWDDRTSSCAQFDETAPSKCMTTRMERVMYDLCTQPESAPAHAEMETQGEAEAEERQQQHEPGELKRKEYKKHRQPEKTFSTTVKITSTSLLGKRHSLYADLSGFEVEAVRKDGTDYGFLLCQNAGLLRALEELEEKCTTLREENVLLRKSTAPGMEEKVRRLRRKNAELAVLAKRLEERARKLQEANLKVGFPASSGGQEFEKLLQESQKEVLRLQRQISVTSSKQAQNQSWGHCDSGKSEESRKEQKENKVGEKTPYVQLDEASFKSENTTAEKEESGLLVTPQLVLSPTSSHPEENIEEWCIQSLESELNKKRKECENLEHEVKKRQKRCLDLKSQLEDERSKNEQLKKEADLLRRKAQLLDQTRAKNEELREELSEVTAQHISVLEENKKLCAKLENLDQVLKHMREVAERRQQLELEHEQALAILKFKQDEIKRLQRAQLFAKREHEGVVQMLENTLDSMQSKVRELEEKCRSQSEQFGLLSQELENFRLQASKVDLATSGLLNNPNLSVLTNGVGLTTERDCTDGSWDMVSLSEIAFWSLESGDPLPCPEGNDPLDVAAALRMGATPHAAGLSRVERSLVAKHRELPTISVCKSGSASSKSDTTHLTPKSDTHHIPHKSSLTHEVDTASEVEELDIDIASAPYTVSRGAAKLQVFIARYSYNPYDGPNDNPEVELPLTAGEYIYVYGDMDDDGFYEGELMDGQRGLVPSNFVDRVSDDDVMSTYHPETGDMSHNSLLDSSLHSATHQQHLHTGVIASERTEALTASSLAAAPSDQASAFAVPAPLTNGLDLDLEEVGVDIVPYPRKLTLIKQLAKSIIIGWDPPLVPAGWGNVWSYNVYVDQELRLNVPFGSQTKAVLERLDINLKAYRVSVQSLTEKGLSDQLCCSMLVGRDVCVAPTQLCVERVTATSANLSWLPSNSNYVHIVSLNEEECELVKAGCYSLCLNNLLPSLQYMVKLEARPHRTPWELPVERREHRSTTITFTTLMAGTPDAPLDVQLERGPSPGIALVSWLPVTIDAAGTSNGVRVTGYTIYADKKKVLEVSSPTAGSVLLGPSQIHSLQAAQALTVRTTSVHSESCDSLSVNVPSKLAAIMSGSAIGAPAVPALTCTPMSPSLVLSKRSSGNSAAKVSVLPSDTQITGLTVEAAANLPHGLHSENPSSASYLNAWANPSCAAAAFSTSPVVPAITPVINVTSPINSIPQKSPVVVPSSFQQQPHASAAPVLDQGRDTDSPGTIQPFPAITEFIDDPSAKLTTPERIPSPPKLMITDLLNPPETNLLRPPSTSPLDSEVEDEIENTRLVSIEEFLRPEKDQVHSVGQQGYARGLVEPPRDYLGDISRSDLSDILEEEEEDLYSDRLGETQARGYSLYKSETPDSEKDVVERIISLPTQVYCSNQLFSIPEVTEEEDSLHEELLSHSGQPQPISTNLHLRNTEHPKHAAQHWLHNLPNPLTNISSHHHFTRDPRYQNKEYLSRQGPVQAKPKTQHRVHYADSVDTIRYPEEDVSLYEGPNSRQVSTCCPNQMTPHSKDRGLLRGLGDRLRREAMLRSQMTAAMLTNSSHGFTPPRSYPISKTVHTLRSPVSRQLEVDVEYGADDNDGTEEYNSGEVVVEQMSSEWWVEGAQVEQSKTPHRRRPKADLLPSQAAPVEAGLSWAGQIELSCKAASLPSRQHKGNSESTKKKDDGEMRIFVALFPYDPVSMSPNPDAAEEELPFREGQIIKIHGDKDADGFYRGESGGRHGYVPCNMVSEIQVEDPETRQQLLQQGFLSTAASMEKLDLSQPAAPPQEVNAPLGARRMVAIFDYDPRESSPNTDIEAELTFSAGDIIQVFGEMDDDGFFNGDLNGQKGLAPSNFLQALPDDQSVALKPAAEPKKESQETWTSYMDPQDYSLPTLEEDLHSQTEHPYSALTELTDQPQASEPDATSGHAVAECSCSALTPPPFSTDGPARIDGSAQAKKKKSLFSKGRKLFKRLGSSKK
ncbi:RIMS-binding protein 2 isoform X4 [Gouania willdenowi]|uniref:RIMS-binding protein 2 isoform X4 n=1 Tax=Gouania willdenowi TaxID=441366 RepID=UPI00105684B1|nr:RIMS-binding protein 2-like isoform X4 [Gouania willdenowi]